jgi:hypothetical protein
MYWCNLGIIDYKCHRILVPSELEKHLNGKHKFIGGARQLVDYTFMANHIISSHNIPLSYNSPTPVEVTEEVYGLGTPQDGVLCPHCNNWFICSLHQPFSQQIRHLRQHMRTYHEGRDLSSVANWPDEFKRRYILYPWGTRVKPSVPLIFAEEYKPRDANGHAMVPLARAKLPPPRSAPSAPFLLRIGYPQYLSDLKASNASENRLRGLVRLPSKSLARERKGKRKYLERGLLVLYGGLKTYLKEANGYLTCNHPRAREALVHKYVLLSMISFVIAHYIASTHSHYHEVHEDTYDAYRSAIMWTVCMLIRFWHAKVTNRMQGLGDFKVIGSSDVAKATGDLYDLFIYSKGLCHEDSSLRKAHPLLDLLLRTKIIPGDLIACATDQALFLVSLRPNSHFQLANSLTRCCAMLQHCFYAITVHIARLEWERLEEYTPVGKPKPNTLPESSRDVLLEQSTLDSDPDSEDSCSEQDGGDDGETSSNGDCDVNTNEWDQDDDLAEFDSSNECAEDSIDGVDERFKDFMDVLEGTDQEVGSQTSILS